MYSYSPKGFSLFSGSIILAIGWAIAIFGHKVVVPNAKTPVLIAFSDPFVHGLIAFLVIWPLFAASSHKEWQLLLFAVLAAVLIDIDHAIAARSFDLRAMLSLPGRPISHSLAFGLLVGITFYFFFREQSPGWKALYVGFVSIASHVLRDGIGSAMTPWAYPFKSVAIDETIFFSLFILISYIHLGYCFSEKVAP